MICLPTMSTPPLHKPSAIFSARHVPSWLLLAFAAGTVNAVTFRACQRFVTHVTGNATRLGMNEGHWLLMAEYGAVLGCFVVGAMASSLAIDARYYRGRAPLYVLPMAVVAALLVAVAVAGAHGLFGPFGTTIETAGDFGLLSVLAFAMGLQNATAASATGLAVRTTHITGPATDLGVHLGTALFAEGEVRRQALRGAALRGGKIAAFVFGAASAMTLPQAAGFWMFLLPALTVLAATALSFVPSWSALDAPRFETTP